MKKLYLCKKVQKFISANHNDIGIFCLILIIIVFTELNTEIKCMMISFNSLKSKIVQNVTSLTTSVFLSFGYKYYSIDPSEKTKLLISNLLNAHLNNDKPQIYCGWVVCATNLNNLMPQNNIDLISRFAKIYNKKHLINSAERLNEEECLNYYGIEFSSCNLSRDLRFPYLNFNETLAMEYVNRSNFGLKLQRNFDNNLRIPNLGLQPNNDCIGIILKHPITGVPVFFYLDIKKTSLYMAMQKLKITNLQDKYMFMIQGSGKKFGCNIFVIATSPDKDIILSINERSEMLNYLEKMCNKYPEVYQGLKESPEYNKFVTTGNWEDLNAIGYPVPIVVKAQNLVPKEILDSIQKSEEYNKLTQGIKPDQLYDLIKEDL